MFDEKKLDFYIRKNYNVLFRGKHGVGKTAMIKEAFERHSLRWKYFSAATMDPWVDFVGVPKEVIEGDKSYIDLVRPKNFQNDEVEAIFMDELNRAPKKVRNAVMELIQFKSINGVPFKNLKMIWGAINPDDEDEADLKYDVEVMDPAQKDRFKIVVNIPYEPSKAYFTRKFDKMGIGAVEWWKSLSPEQNALVSPRRLEYAIEVYVDGGDIRDVLSEKELNINQLLQRLSKGSIAQKLKDLYENASDDVLVKEFSDSNFTTNAVPYIMKKDEYITKFCKFIQKDILSKLISENEGKNIERILKHSPANVIAPILSSMMSANTLSRPLIMRIKEYAEEYKIDLTSEHAFKTAIEEALKLVAGERNDRYLALQSVYTNFNIGANLETYESAIEFVAKVLYHSDSKSIEDNTKPVNQLSEGILNKLEIELAKHNTSVIKVWNSMKKTIFSGDESRIERVEKYINLLTTNK